MLCNDQQKFLNKFFKGLDLNSPQIYSIYMPKASLSQNKIFNGYKTGPKILVNSIVLWPL